ncbi:MAG: cytochrome c biogenesis protein CcsA [Gammaproteobacteria bacterium]|nr:cytochrome c biogenesis protein CcsA [Gammaproteobacteria bacterium]
MWVWFHKLGSPPYFYRLSSRLLPWLAVATLISFVVGTIWGLFYAPSDYQQADTSRIMYIHVPAAMFSMSIYMVIAAAGAVTLIWRIKLADLVAAASAPIGASYTFIALITGSLWGRTMWGDTYWEWTDPRLMSELILFFLYLGYMALNAAFEDRRRAARAAAVLALVGVVNIPIIHYSVEWWTSLHQGSTTRGMQFAATIYPSMRYPLYLMMLAFAFFYAQLMFKNTRCLLLESERNNSWVKEMVTQHDAA